MSPNVPCTSTTGLGCSAVGVQLQSFAPGGEIPGATFSCAALAAGNDKAIIKTKIPQSLPFTHWAYPPWPRHQPVFAKICGGQLVLVHPDAMYTHHKVDHEFPGGVPTEISYMVCSVPRCGSSLLCEWLCNTGVAGAPTEFFDPELQRRFSHRWDARSFDAYVEELLRRKTSPNGVFGIKVHWEQLVPILEQTNPGDLFPSLRFVHIGRQDRLRQAISWLRATQTNQWASTHDAVADPVFERGAIDRYLARIDAQERQWEQFFGEEDLTPHRVLYERLVEDPADVVGDALDFVGVSMPGGGVPGPFELERQADETTERWVDEYLEGPQT
jgi:LPS sulfotransferase NodH